MHDDVISPLLRAFQKLGQKAFARPKSSAQLAAFRPCFVAFVPGEKIVGMDLLALRFSIEREAFRQCDSGSADKTAKIDNRAETAIALCRIFPEPLSILRSEEHTSELQSRF